MDFVFVTYIIALLGLAAGLYAVLSVREIEKRLDSKKPTSQSKKTSQPIKVDRPKGHWD